LFSLNLGSLVVGECTIFHSFAIQSGGLAGFSLNEKKISNLDISGMKKIFSKLQMLKKIIIYLMNGA